MDDIEAELKKFEIKDEEPVVEKPAPKSKVYCKYYYTKVVIVSVTLYVTLYIISLVIILSQ